MSRGETKPVDAIVGGLVPKADAVPIMLCRACPGLKPNRLHGAERDTGICSACANPWREEARAARARGIPRTWPRLDAPIIPPDGDVPVVSCEARVQAAEWLAGREKTLTIAGPETGAGKTVLACAVANAHLDVAGSLLWINALELRSDGDRAQANAKVEAIRQAKGLIVIDDVGAEAGRGAAGSPIAAMRIPAMTEVLDVLYQREDVRVVYTTGLTGAQLVELYGSNGARRIGSTNNATVIVLRRIRPLNMAEIA